MRISEGHKIICDGKYTDEAGELVPCGKTLHSGTVAQINKIGILGHHCEFCHDPSKTAALCERLDVTEEELRKMSEEERKRAIIDADKKDGEAAAAAKRKQERDAAVAALKPNEEGKWPVGSELFETKKDAIDFLNGKAKNGGWPPK